MQVHNLLNNKFQFEESAISNLINLKLPYIFAWTDRSYVHFLGKPIFIVIGVTDTFILSSEIITVGLGFARMMENLWARSLLKYMKDSTSSKILFS